MKKMLERGFTLIELLVVIAIIGILAAVVLASLNDARDSGSDASIKQTMSSLRNQAELSYNTNNFSYANVCTDVADLEAAVNNANGGQTDLDCNAEASNWAATVQLVSSDDLWCVDSTGYAGTSTALAGTDFACP